MTDDLDEPETGEAETTAAASSEEVFTGAEAAKLLGITNVRLSRYVEDLHLDIPRGKSLRITRSNFEVLRTYHRNRADGPRFRESEQAREYAASLKEYARIFRSLKKLTAEALTLEKRLRKAVPAGLGVIHTLPEPDLVLVTPLRASIAPSGKRYRASLPEADIEAMGSTRDEALLELREEITRVYKRLEKGHFFNTGDRERLRVLKILITRRPPTQE
ncbi:MAG TPA: hypothetical protein VEW48_06830 [Thermoanaerobaculia bacterium]|nr:hypothetical protein [Thermoanaerobaculia bacterium]